ncbi:hypothetical protein [Pararobbsia silviterrae]|nr:hypothetical protein [Pararobbsia silviterrae]
MTLKKLFIFSIVVLSIVACILLGLSQLGRVLGKSWFPIETDAAQYADPNFGMGNLGGVPVRIPLWFAEHVEYEGDPGFMGKREGPIPKRTMDSPLTSFDFNVRFPDMAGRTSPALWWDYEKYANLYWDGWYDSISPWMFVGVETGSRYYGIAGLERVLKYRLTFNPDLDPKREREYQKLPEDRWGLVAYATRFFDPESGNAYHWIASNTELYVNRSRDGRLNTYIACTNHYRKNVLRLTCTQSFSLEPRMKAEAHVSYPRYFLPYWKEIQRLTGDLIWSFRLDEAATTPSTGDPSSPAR